MPFNGKSAAESEIIGMPRDRSNDLRSTEMPSVSRPQRFLWLLAACATLGTGAYVALLWDVHWRPPKFQLGEVTYFLNYEQAAKSAQYHGKPLLIVFNGVNSVNCRRMEGGVLRDPTVLSRMRKFVCLTAFVDQQPAADPIEKKIRRLQNDRLQEWFGEGSLPAYVIVAPERQVSDDFRELRNLGSIVGFEPDPLKFAHFLDDSLSRWAQLRVQDRR